MSLRRALPKLVFLLALSAGVVAPRRALASDDVARDPLTQEIVGLELHAMSLASGEYAPTRPGVGLGAQIRFGRHRWTRAYFTPVEGGFFWAPEGESDFVFSARLLTEGGAVFRTAAGVIEVGLGAGAGVLLVAWSGSKCNRADGCDDGGRGVLLSPVVRWLANDTTRVPIGIVLRGDVPAMNPSSSPGPTSGFGAQVLLGFDVGLGQ